MEQTEIRQQGWGEAGPGRPAMVGGTCNICVHEQAPEIHRLLVELVEPVTYIYAKMGEPFNPVNLRRHLRNCVKKTWHELKANQRIGFATDVDNRLAALMNEAEEAYYAAKAVLLVDGDLNLNIREHEISVVYLDYNDRNDKTNEPKLKSAPLSKLLAIVAEGGYHVQHSYIKAEDARPKAPRVSWDSFASIPRTSGVSRWP